MVSTSRSLSLDLSNARNGNDSIATLLRTPSLSSSSGIAESSKTVFSKLDKLNEQETNGTRQLNGADQYYHIRKDHWVDSKQVSKCTLCGKSFGFPTKKHNCRRCGKIFCDSCCQYRRRLSKHAEPDQNGNLYRVCYHCAELNVQTIGQTRSLTSFFNEQRKNKRVNIIYELGRLVEGFISNIKSSRLKSYTTETISIVKVPNWQKSSNWLESSEVEWCSNCSTKFSYLMQKHHCRICGVVVCWKCCLQDLMLYYDNNKCAHWTLIKVVGCPDTEPSVCLYLSVCHPCREEIEEVQVQKFYGDSLDGQSSFTMEKIESVLNDLQKLEDRITNYLPRYQELTEALVDGKKLNEIAESGSSVVQMFAKLQFDISDVFTEYSFTIQRLKKLQMSTRTEIKVMRNVVDIKCAFYARNTSLFKSVKENLSKSLPADALQSVQDYANKHSINNTCIIVKQLGYEALILADTYHFTPTIAIKLSEVDQICFQDLQKCISTLGGNWNEHDQALKELLKLQLADHKLVKPPKSSKTRDRGDFVAKFLLDRTVSVLAQTLAALEAKASEKKFIETKESMKRVLKSFETVQKENNKWTIPG